MVIQDFRDVFTLITAQIERIIRLFKRSDLTAEQEQEVLDSLNAVNDRLAAITGNVQPSDTTPPTVAITGPSDGSSVFGTINLNATASDNVGVVGVQFKVDGVNVGAESMVAPYTASWNTAGAGNGLHTITAVARDAAGNSTISTSVAVTVSN